MSDAPEAIPSDGAPNKAVARSDSLSVFEHAAGAKHIGQGTAVEQARAVAEVRAAVLIAMERPRNVTSAIAEMRSVCQIADLAERAFFSVKRGGGAVNGDSIHLARELARCWGNINYGVKELVRDDQRRQSEMLAFAWDLQTNARSEITFVIPHERHTRNGATALKGTQEIYENNASFAGRRLRECIFAVLPVWFRAEAATICRRTLENGGGKPLAQRAADCVAYFEGIGITRATLERRQGKPVDEWIAEDVANLGILYKSLKRNEITREEAFPDEPAGKATPAIGSDHFEKASAGKPIEDAGSPADDYIASVMACRTEAAVDQFTGHKDSAAAFKKFSKEDQARINQAVCAHRESLTKPSGDDGGFPGKVTPREPVA